MPALMSSPAPSPPLSAMHVAFASVSALRIAPAPQRSSCLARRRAVPAASAEQWETPSEWQTAGKGVPEKGLQRIEFIIRQDGRVEEKVTGVRGTDCLKLTEKIEKALGHVMHSEKTEEYYEQVYETLLNKEVVKPGDALYVSDPDIPSW